MGAPADMVTHRMRHVIVRTVDIMDGELCTAFDRGLKAHATRKLYHRTRDWVSQKESQGSRLQDLLCCGLRAGASDQEKGT